MIKGYNIYPINKSKKKLMNQTVLLITVGCFLLQTVLLITEMIWITNTHIPENKRLYLVPPQHHTQLVQSYKIYKLQGSMS